MHQSVLNLKQAVTRLVRAEVAASWSGASQPDERHEIAQELNNATTNFQAKLRLVDELIPEGPPIPVFPDGS